MDKLTKEHRSWNMSRIRGKNTAPEIAMCSMLHKNGFRFRLQEKNLPGKPDIVLPKFKTAIFVHGCFWHRHENCKYCYTPKSRNEFWNSKFQRTIQRDAEQLQAVSKTGWFPLVIWECEIKDNPANTLRKVMNILQKRLLKIQGGV
jgi:DNA mismatch endonuclease, patch repair protein